MAPLLHESVVENQAPPVFGLAGLDWSDAESAAVIGDLRLLVGAHMWRYGRS
jgi:hypothetical protein